MGFGQWCSPRCCTGYKYNVILPWVQEACLIDKCEGKKKKSDSTEYQCVSKYVSAPESHKAKAMLDGIWLWLILLMLKEGEDVEGATESVMSVSGLHREHQTNHQNICAEGEKKINWISESLFFVFPSVIFLHAPERIVFILSNTVYPWFSFSVPLLLCLFVINLCCCEPLLLCPVHLLSCGKNMQVSGSFLKT